MILAFVLKHRSIISQQCDIAIGIINIIGVDRSVLIDDDGRRMKPNITRSRRIVGVAHVGRVDVCGGTGDNDRTRGVNFQRVAIEL